MCLETNSPHERRPSMAHYFKTCMNFKINSFFYFEDANLQMLHQRAEMHNYRGQGVVSGRALTFHAVMSTV